MSDTFQQLLKQEILKKKIYTGAIVKGKIIEVTSKYVTIDAGLKSNSVININEFYDKNNKLEVCVSDIVDVIIENVNDNAGYTHLSREKVKIINSWKILEDAHTYNSTVVGKIINRVKGGFIVETESIKSFLPGSLTDVKLIRDYDKLEGKVFDFKVLKINRKNNNIVLSRKAALEETISIDKNLIVNNLHEDQIVSGLVKNITDYGVFVDLGGIDGLLHITDLSWGKVKHPSNIVSIGQSLDVIILKFDEKKNRVSLGLKQLKVDPWFDIKIKYTKNKKLTGTVTNTLEYGYFVELEPGVEGLVHISEINWVQKNNDPKKGIKLNEKIDVIILSIDEKKRRIALGLKQKTENPWLTFSKNKIKGDIITGIVKSVTTFGIFIELNENIDGLVHLNDITWNKSPIKAIKAYKKGDEITAMILFIDSTRERISLGIKQMLKNPLTEYMYKYKIGTIVSGTIKKISTKNTIIQLTDDVEGIIETEELKKDILLVDNSITATITGQDYKLRFITLTKDNK